MPARDSKAQRVNASAAPEPEVTVTVPLCSEAESIRALLERTALCN